MITNNILERKRNGEKALGLSFGDNPTEELIEMAGRMGLDFVNFDGQHSPLTPERVGQLCRVADGFGLTATMRIPDGQESTILGFLDKGIRGITVPNLQTKEEAELIVKWSYFAPLGLRSATSYRTVMNQTGTRTQLYEDINANTIVACQLESVTAFDNLDEILTVDGLNYFGGGREDVAQSMGMPGQAAHPKPVEAYERAAEKVRATKGKFIISDFTESIALFNFVRGGVGELLKKHGREPKLLY